MASEVGATTLPAIMLIIDVFPLPLSPTSITLRLEVDAGFMSECRNSSGKKKKIFTI